MVREIPWGEALRPSDPLWVITIGANSHKPLDPSLSSANDEPMDAVAALAAPRVRELAIGDMADFLGRRGVRVVHATDGRPFGAVLKTLLHGRLGSELRCGRLDLGRLEATDESTRRISGPLIDLAGLQGAFPPPAGYYVFRGPTLVGFHPELEPSTAELPRLARLGVRGLLRLAKLRDLDRAGREALSGAPELDIVEFFEEVAQGWTPRRAPAASDRRKNQERRGPRRDSKPRRARERLEAELDSAFRLLGATPDMSLRRIKAARNRLMRDNHPDRLQRDPSRHADATRLTVRINEAYTAIRKAREADRAE